MSPDFLFVSHFPPQNYDLFFKETVKMKKNTSPVIILTGQSSEERVPKCLKTLYIYQPGVGYLECVDEFEHSSTIKRLSLKRRPRSALNNAEKTQNDISSSQWHSAESLSLSSSSDDTRLMAMSSTPRGRPPLPPPYGSSSETKLSRNEGTIATQILPKSKPQPTARSHALQRQNSLVEKTLMETHTNLDQEGTIHSPPEPHPRRRLASFGGVSSTGSPSPFTGLGAYNQNNNGNKPPGTGSDMYLNLSSSMASRGSTGCLRLSPQSSGRSTPVSLGPMHLQHVRDQMVVALQKLKELEEQVKIIPILQVKISVLQEEKRQLISHLKDQNDSLDVNDLNWKSIYSKVDDEGVEGLMQSDYTSLREFRQLTEEMQELERTIKGGHLQAQHRLIHSTLHGRTTKSDAVGTENTKDINLSKSTRESKYVYTEQVETRSIATGVSEVNLGIYTEREEEYDSQQLIIEALKDKIRHLEAELKESALQTEMSRLKLELKTAGARNRVDKASTVRPSTECTGTEARPHTKSQGVGNHIELRDAGTGEMMGVKRCTVGVSCHPELKNVSSGPDVPMNHWEVRERKERREKCVGIQVITNTQGVGTEIEVCNAGTNTEPVENWGSGKREINYCSVACGDCSVDVIISEAKEVVSYGISTEPVRGVDIGIMASPQTVSQRTNTVTNSVSRFTNTKDAFNMDSSTNTVLSMQDKHTNTTQTVTRTVSVGNGVRDIKSARETRSIGVGTAILVGGALRQMSMSKMTRDFGVGFTNIHENYLVGLKTRNMASGPSHLPDPIKTRSIGVGEGKIWNFSVSSSTPDQMPQQLPQSQCDPDLNHYIEKMQRFLQEHEDLLTDNYSDQRKETAEQQSRPRNRSSKSCYNNEAVTQEGSEDHHLDSQSQAKFQSPAQLSSDSRKSSKGSPGICHLGSIDSEVKRRIQMLEQQTSSTLQDRPCNVSKLQSVKKKQNGDQGCSSNRKSMTFMKVTTGLDPVSIYELSVSEAISVGVKQRGDRKLKDVSGLDGIQAGDGVSNKGLRGSKSQRQQRLRFSEKMIPACEALRTHLSNETVLSRKELDDCLQTLQHEWFSVSSQKAAVPDIVDNYLSTFRGISPAVLHHVANMADGNGNTALHYSVSHSNFGVVKTLLKAEVCNMNQQNEAGFTPIMLAALAAVGTPGDMRVAEDLFSKGDVNAKASQAGQTALMLAVSHGRMDMVQALLAQGAEVNLQDDEGSTALMCASEHGHADIVKLLLAQPDCDATLTDSDESTALSIALEAGHNDIGVLLYAHANFSKGQTGAAARHGGKSVSCSGGRSLFE
ncbi:KN motif and ankyrin repeat domains 1-like [Genypterus blacodes]|uniref:KN motif and ankyrin repeat domains 1-like n=1 Tax=Genypterus blacodes TaxID=154954 RepID=UPI003F767DD5